jgi:hypothetical protein
MEISRKMLNLLNHLDFLPAVVHEYKIPKPMSIGFGILSLLSRCRSCYVGNSDCG